MDLQVLHIFRTVAQEGSMVRAAKRLHCVQSNVSTRLIQLEECLGVSLFFRVGRRLEITPEGTKLLDYAERLLQLADEAKSMVRGKGEPTGKLRIGAMESTAAVRLPNLLAAYHLKYPLVEIVLKTGSTDSLIQDILEHRIDLAMVAGSVCQPELDQAAVFKEELVLISALGNGLILSPSDLGTQTLLVFRAGCVYRTVAENWFSSIGSSPSRIIEIGTIEAIIGCVVAGMGVSIMPQSIIEQRRISNAIKCHPLPKEIAAVNTLAIWRNDIDRHLARQRFVDMVIESPAQFLAPVYEWERRITLLPINVERRVAANSLVSNEQG